MARGLFIVPRGFVRLASNAGLCCLLALVIEARLGSAQGGPPLLLVGGQDYAPLSYLEGGVATGYDVDVARALAGALGRDVRVELMDWPTAQSRVLSGQADGLTNLAISDERRSLYDFADSTITQNFGLFVRIGDTTLHGVADLAGRRVGVTEWGFPRQYLERQRRAQLVIIDDLRAGFGELIAGRLDVIAADVWVATHIIEERRIAGVALAGAPFASLPAAIAVKKGNQALLDDINRAIRTLQADGTLLEIQERWRPREMVFLSRERVLDLVAWGITGFVALLLAAATIWALTLRKEMRARRGIESERTQGSQRLSLALAAAEMGTWRWVTATNLDTRDANLNRILGLEAVESVQPLEDIFARVHPDDLGAMKSEFERAIRERNTYSCEFRIIRPDGSERRLRGRGKPFYAESGQLSYVTGAAVDVTEQRHAEERLSLLAHALGSASDCIVITDPDQQILYVNDAFLRTYEYAEGELIGQPIDIVAVPDQSRDVQDAWATEAASEWRGDVWNRSKSGRAFPVSLATSVVRHPSGEIAARVSVARDITNQQLAEDALRASEEKFYKAFQGSPDAVAIIDFISGVLEVNDSFERVTGYSRSEVVGRRLQDVGMLLDPFVRDTTIAELRARGSRRDFEVQLRRKTGELITLLVSAETVEISGRECFMTISRDITERKRFEMHVRQAAEVNKLLLSHLDLDGLYVAVIEAAHQILTLDYASLVLHDPESRTLRVHAQRGVVDAARSQRAGLALSTRALERGQLRVFRGDEIRGLGEAAIDLSAAGLRALCALPLVTPRGIVGTLNVGSRNEEALSADDITLLQQLSTHVAIAIQNARAYEEIKVLKDRVSDQNLYLEEEIRVDHNFADIIGESPAIKRVLQQIETVAPTDASVLLLGETGTGKELLARALHNLSARKSRSFVRLNIAALPTTLLESELFGYERGAFTGAAANKAGRMELADRGTLFLDEVGDVPLEVQPKLLRALQEREFERLGSTRTQKVDVRMIAATNRDLAAMVDEGTYRRDLFYRLNVFPIQIPPLRDRRDDIPLLVRYFVQKFSSRMKRQIATIPGATMAALQDWHWPGNIRELENVIERAVIVSASDVLQVPPFQVKSPFDAGPARLLQPVTARAMSPGSFKDGERDIILRALRDSDGVIAGPEGAAARLGIKRTTLQSKMRKLGIRRPTF